MRICYLTHDYPVGLHGGMGTFVRSMGQSLTKLGHEVTVVIWGRSGLGTTWDDGIRLVPVPLPHLLNCELRVGRYELKFCRLAQRILLSARLAQIVRDTRPDVVESYDWTGPLWWRPKCPLVVRIHGANSALRASAGKRPYPLLWVAERRNLRMADATVAVSHHILEWERRALRLRSLASRVIYNGVDTQAFRPGLAQQTEAEVLYVGRPTPAKGFTDLLAAMPLVLKEVPTATFTIAGPVPGVREQGNAAGAMLAALPLAMRGSVNFLGHVPHGQLPTLYCRATVCVFPTRVESFGLSTVEAMACGAAVVVSSLATGPEITGSGRAGLLVDPRDTQALADAVIRLLRDRHSRATVGRAARDRVLSMFDLSHLARQNEALYEGVIDS